MQTVRRAGISGNGGNTRQEYLFGEASVHIGVLNRLSTTGISSFKYTYIYLDVCPLIS